MPCIAPFAIALLAMIVAPAAHARTTPGMERLYGATLNNAAIGDGRLSACFAESGTLTCLRWPDPTHFTVIDHTTSNAEDAREQQYFGAKPFEGSFAGLAYGGFLDRRTSWLRDEWEFSQYYESPDSSVLVTEYTNDELGVTIIDRSTVVPERNLLIRQYTVTGADALEDPALVYYENLDTAAQVTEGAPTEWLDNGQRDTACIVNNDRGYLTHPGHEGLETPYLDSLVKPPSGVAALEEIANAPEIEFWVLVGAREGDTTMHCGPETGDRNGFDYADEGGMQPPQIVSKGESAGVISIPLEGAEATATVFFAYEATLDAAEAVLADARALTDEDLFSATDAWWAEWLDAARLPDTDNQGFLDFSKRALMSIITGTDPDSGAIVASVSNNPPYAYSWPRDGVYFDMAMNVAGLVDIATAHQLYFARVMRWEDGEQPNVFCGDGSPNSFEQLLGTCAPAGSWSMNYLSDGRVGGPIGFEIDQVGVTLWSMAEQVKWLAGPVERAAYLDEVYPAITLAADLLVKCKDPDNDLQCKANEDDNPAPTQGQQGAFNAAAGLRNAVFAAQVMGESDDAARWQARLEELETAMNERWSVLDGDNRHVGDGETPAGWAMLPARTLYATDVTEQEQVAYIYDRIDQPGKILQYDTSPDYDGGQYDTKHALRMALHWDADHPEGGKTLEFLELLALDLPTPGTLHYGEHYLYEDSYNNDGVKEWVQTVATPHIWEQTLVYLSLMAYYNNDIYQFSNDPADYPLPGQPPIGDDDDDDDDDGPPEAPYDDSSDSGCGCTQGTPTGSLIWLLPFVLLWWRRRNTVIE